MNRLNLSEWALKHQQMIVFLILLLSLSGIWSYTQLGRKEDPEFTVKAMVVQAYWPGASTQQMSDQVTDKLEKALQEIAEIYYTRSYVKPGETLINITLREELKGEEVPDVWYQVRKKLGDIKHTLPDGVRGPVFNDEFGDTFGNLLAITGKDYDYPALKQFADTARNELLQLADVKKVNYVGEQAEKIYVEVSNAKMASLGIDPRLIANTLNQTNVVSSAGVVDSGAERIRLQVTGEFDSVDSIGAIGIHVGDRIFRLSDIATIKRGVIDPATFKMRFNGQEAVGLAVSMRKGGDVIRLGQQLNDVVKRLEKSLPAGVGIHAVSDQPKVVSDSFSEFTHSLIEAIAIVLAVSFLSLGMRTGLVVALSIPLVLASTFMVMYAMGIDLQRISLGALIIALGLLVDDAIIAVEMMMLKLEQGWDRVRAATYAYTATAFPMLTGTLITAAGFMPVGMAKSSAGEYTGSIFQVVGISLMLSWIVAVLFTPYLGYKLLPEHTASEHGHDDVYQGRFYQLFRKLVTWCLHYRKSVVVGTLALFVASVAIFSTVPKQFFPASNRLELIVDMWLPQASTFAEAEKQAKALEQRFIGNDDVVSVTSYVGGGSPRFYLPLDVQTPNLRLVEVMIVSKDEAARERVIKQLHDTFENDFPSVRARVNRLENGPPVGYPVQIRVSGPEVKQVENIASQVSDILRAHPNARRVNQDWGESLKSLRVNIDQDKARALGITSKQIADSLQTAQSGLTITRYLEDDKDIDVVARVVAEERTDLNNLKDAKIYLRQGKFIPLSQIAKLELIDEPSEIWRRNRTPTITVRADVVGAEGPDVTASLAPTIAPLQATLPLGYQIKFGGAFESSAEAQKSISAVMPLAILVVLVLLMIQLQDMQKMLLVLLTAPLGLIGVALIMASFSIPFGFVAMLGVIALAGMIIRNSVILVVQIDHDVEQGEPLWNAIIESAVRRFRPIILTALAAILAMIPLTRSTFWGPMAWAIMGGLFVATLLTLLFLPALYALWYRVRPSVQKASE